MKSKKEKITVNSFDYFVDDAANYVNENIGTLLAFCFIGGAIIIALAVTLGMILRKSSQNKSNQNTFGDDEDEFSHR